MRDKRTVRQKQFEERIQNSLHDVVIDAERGAKRVALQSVEKFKLYVQVLIVLIFIVGVLIGISLPT